MGDFSSPIDLGLPATPGGVPDELYEEFNKLYQAIRTLQQKFGTYNGLEVLDPTRFINELAPNATDSIQVQRLTPVLVTAGIALSAGQFVFLMQSGGVLTAMKADGAVGIGRRAHGWVPNAIANGAKGIVYLQLGVNTGFAGMTIGQTYYLSTSTPGGITSTPPVAVGTLYQEIGIALSSTELFVTLSGYTKLN